MYKKSNRIICMGLMLCMTSAMVLGGCGQKSENSGKIEIELVQYKPLKRLKKNSMQLMMIFI